MSVDATKKLIQDLSVELLGKLQQTVVKEVPLPKKKDGEEKSEAPKLKKKDVIASIIKEIEKFGVKKMVEALKVVDAETICEKLEIDFEDNKNKHSRNVLSKRMRQRVVRDGLDEVLSKLQPEHHKACFEALALPAENGTPRANAIKISGEIRRIGAEVVLSKMDMNFLKQLGEEQGLDLFDINSQITVIQAILNGEVPAKRARVEPKKEPISKKKPKLEAGITVTDMMQHYNLSELQDFARDNGITISGKKKDLMKRISTHFAENSTENTKPTKKAKVEKKEETKKEETKKEKKAEKKTEKKKEEKVEETEEAEEEAEEAEAEAEEEKKEDEKKKKDTPKKKEETKKETPKSPKGKSPKKPEAKKGKKEVGER